jgi:hypothetical protein
MIDELTLSLKRHETKVLYLDGKRCLIDRNIAPLIDGLFKLGIHTTGSCEADCGGWCNRKHPIVNGFHGPTEQCLKSVWLAFDTADDGMRFLNTVSRPEDDSMLREQMRGFSYGDDVWQWRHYISTVNSPQHTGPMFVLWINCIFPHAHLKLVTDRVLAEANK